MWYGFSVPFDTLYVISWTILYGSDDPANNVRALKDVRISEIKQSAIGYKIFLVLRFHCTYRIVELFSDVR